MQVAGKGALKSNSDMEAGVSSTQDTGQNTAKFKSLLVPFGSLYSSS